MSTENWRTKSKEPRWKTVKTSCPYVTPFLRHSELLIKSRVCQQTLRVFCLRVWPRWNLIGVIGSSKRADRRQRISR